MARKNSKEKKHKFQMFYLVKLYSRLQHYLHTWAPYKLCRFPYSLHLVHSFKSFLSYSSSKMSLFNEFVYYHPSSTQQMFLFDSQAWKHYYMEIIGYNNIYLLNKYHTLQWKYFLFLAQKHFAVYIIRQTSLTVRLKKVFCGDYHSQQLFT